jgi:hypothetical protein
MDDRVKLKWVKLLTSLVKPNKHFWGTLGTLVQGQKDLVEETASRGQPSLDHWGKRGKDGH